jgi:hypothetical protein
MTTATESEFSGHRPARKVRRVPALRALRHNPHRFPPPDPNGWKVYYSLDPLDPPTIREVAEQWAWGRVAARDSREHARYSLRSILESARPGNFLRVWKSHESERRRWREFVGQVRVRGITTPLSLDVYADGSVRVGEGQHRVAALLEIFPPGQRSQVMVPVVFWFKDGPPVPPQGGWPTWATFRDPEAFFRPDATPEIPRSHRRSTRRHRSLADYEESRRPYIASAEDEYARQRIDELLDLIGASRGSGKE